MLSLAGSFCVVERRPAGGIIAKLPFGGSPRSRFTIMRVTLPGLSRPLNRRSLMPSAYRRDGCQAATLELEAANNISNEPDLATDDHRTVQ